MARLPQTAMPMRFPARWMRGSSLAACVCMGLLVMGCAPASAAPATPVRVQLGDTLYGIAKKLLGPGVSLEQMVVGLYRSNPDAFVQGNMNRLKAGSVLSVPNTEDLLRVSDVQARRLLVEQIRDFKANPIRTATDTGKVQTATIDRQQGAASRPDRFALSQGTASTRGARGSSREPSLAEAAKRREAATRLAELARNVEDLKKLQPRSFAVQPPAQVASPAAPATTNPNAQPATPTLPSFPWPPPRASAEAGVPENWLPAGSQAVLGDVAGKLERALAAAQFRRWSYLAVPNGFALVTQMEQIQPDGHPSSEPARWSTAMPPISSLGFFDFVRALANALPGYYRVIVFVVTDQPRSRTEGPPSAATAEQWLATGLDRLPSEIARVPYGSQRRVAALVYEFRKPSDSVSAQFIPESQIQGSLHLQRAGIAEPLSRP